MIKLASDLDTVPTMPTTIFTLEWLERFWFYVKWFMSFNMPIFMICMAILVAGLVIDMIGDTVKEATKEDDDDLDIRGY